MMKKIKGIEQHNKECLLMIKRFLLDDKGYYELYKIYKNKLQK